MLGKNSLMDDWRPGNPTVFGPCMLDHPKDRLILFEEFNARNYLVPSAWVRDMFAPYFGDRVVIWPIGIDLELWSDFSAEPKTLDFIVYEKFLWDRPEKVKTILAPTLDELRRRGFSVEVVHCGYYKQANYRELLRRAKRLIFLCEHETQGQAYQQALACNVPVLAWDQGWWLDPKARRYEERPVPASSVPYFSPSCGLTFRSVTEFSRALPRFWETTFSPRAYVAARLGLTQSAQRYYEIVQGASEPSPSHSR